MVFARFMGSHRVVPLAALMLAGAILLPGDNAVSAAGPGVLERLGNGGEGGVAISADGRFVAITIEGFGEPVLLVDRKNGSAQTIGLSWSWGAIDISADGRYVAFATREQLVPEDTLLCCTDIYVYDREQDSYELVSVASDGSPGDGDSDGWYDAISISADGRFVTFSSWAENLAPDGSGVFVRDRLLATTVRLPGYSEAASISADGRFVALDGISVYDRDTDEDGIYDEPDAVETLGLGPGIWPTISADGRFVAYYGQDGITLHDRQTDAAVTVPQGGYPSAAMELSGDGRYLAFATDQPLVPEDTNGFFDVYLYDRLTATSELLSVAKDGSLGNNHSAWGFLGESLAMVALTPDARYAAFHSWATNFVPGEGPGVFVAGPSLPVDTDGDGCSDKQELGPQASLGGRRDPESFWDFFDVYTGDPPVRDKIVSAGDIGGVIARFGTSRESPPTKEEALAEAITPPTDLTSYHPAFDRNGSIPGQEPWNLLPPDGSITAGDIGAVVVQFGHTCA